MKVVSYRKHLPVEDPESLIDAVIERPAPGPRDLLVQVRAISVNPVDTKVRRGAGPGQPSGELKILGWDAAGIVVDVGADVTLFAPGDEVYYAGSLDRPGSYAEFQAVDERIVGKKPATLSFADAAALPLTTITAWEMLFDRFALPTTASTPGTLLIIGGAGGVGSIAIQLAKKLTGLKVIATASRPETVEWCQKLGADAVIDHRQPLGAQVKQIAPAGADYVLALTKTEDHFDEIIEAVAPEAAICLIENLARPVDINKLKPKSLSLHWEFMFARARPQSPKMSEQGSLLNQVAALVDAGQIRSTAVTHLGEINAKNLKRAHALVESGKAMGKVVLEGF
ncbi:MAG: zinc-binding alcohol dehydrogenase family protein [Prosthecobacter sp.]|jgi:NADPH2:quinone reductase